MVWQVAGEQQGTLPAACVTGFGARQRTPQCLSASILRRVHDANRADASPAFAELTDRSLHARRCRREGIQHARQLLVGVLQAVTAHRRCPAVRRRCHSCREELPLVLLHLRAKQRRDGHVSVLSEEEQQRKAHEAARRAAAGALLQRCKTRSEFVRIVA